MKSSKTSKDIQSSSRILMTQQEYVFKILQPADAQSAIDILANSFNNDEPLSSAYYRQFPMQYHKRLEKWVQYWRLYANDISTNGLSCGCFDTSKDNELVGVSVAKNIQYNLEASQGNYMNDLNFMSSLVGVQESILHKADQKWLPILAQKDVMEYLGVAIKKKNQGKFILGKMIECSTLLAQEQGYKFAVGYALNYKSGLATKRLHFEKIAELKVEDFQMFGERPFIQVDEANKYGSVWIKKLGTHKSSL